MPEVKENTKKVPVRTCAICGANKIKKSMLRLDISSGESIKIDPSGKGSGRGAYACSKDCWFKNDAPDKIARSLRISLYDLNWDSLRNGYKEKADSKEQ